MAWSEEDGEHVGLCADAYPSLSWLAPTPEEALRGIETLVAEIDDETKERSSRWNPR
ncbi:antitoxin HicB [Segniliparus rugosus]|uniref:antitoxin HicB n=1 Tax=Segniliparus rugosus TaxID=286804 RepID=UPI0003001060|nr:antitoxin HicB [Segniliparus rugosus]